MSEQPSVAAGQVDLEPEHCTDLGNARRLVRMFGQDMRYVPARGEWRVWTGTHWARDETGHVERFAKAVAEELYREAGFELDERRRRELAKHAMQSESVRAIRGMVTLAQSERGIAEAPSAFDRDLWLLNVANGTIELRTQGLLDAAKLREHRRGDLITKLIPVAYDPSATCETFLAFLKRIFSDRQQLIEYVQRAIGYSLTGLTTEQILWLCWGVGANGKTTLMQAIARLLSGYSASLAAETLLARKGDTALAMNDLAEVQGARFVVAVESDMGRRLAEALVKAVTGGESVKVKRLYADVYAITPTFKLWIGTNHKPVIRGTDHAIWRRIHLVPFETIIPEAEQDHQLLDKLEAERPGILAWAVAGCLAWQRGGLGTPEEVRRATAAYRSEMDALGDFLADRCILDAQAAVTAGELHDAYSDWSKRAGEAQLSKRALHLQLTERGFVARRTKNERTWVGLRLRGLLDGDASPVVTLGDAVSDNFLLRARESGSSQNKRHQASPVTDASPEPWAESDMFDPPGTEL